MNEALFKSFAEGLTKIVSRDEAGRGAPKLCRADDFASAARAFAPLEKVAVVSGFYIPAARAPETDGPIGAAVLARAFQKEGRACEIWTDKRCIDVFKKCAEAAGCVPDCVRLAPMSLDAETPEGIIFIERLGHTADGRYYNFRKNDITEWTEPLDLLAEEAQRKNIRTVGIGDGGNEVGMGNFYGELAALLPDYLSCLSVVRADFAIVADVSNWGAYAMAEALSFIWNCPRGIEPGEETKILEAAVRAGAVDGISGKCETSVDGFNLQTLEQKVLELCELRRKYAALASSKN